MATALCVVVIEAILIYTRNPTLSEGFGKALAHPVYRFPTLLVWGFLSLHLHAVLMPEKLRLRFKKYDPLANLARVLESHLDKALTD